MNKTTIAIISAVGGTIVGGVAGYFIGKKVVGEKLTVEFAEDLNELREYYMKKAEKKEDDIYEEPEETEAECETTEGIKVKIKETPAKEGPSSFSVNYSTCFDGREAERKETEKIVLADVDNGESEVIYDEEEFEDIRLSNGMKYYIWTYFQQDGTIIDESQYLVIGPRGQDIVGGLVEDENNWDINDEMLVVNRLRNIAVRMLLINGRFDDNHYADDYDPDDDGYWDDDRPDDLD